VDRKEGKESGEGREVKEQRERQREREGGGSVISKLNVLALWSAGVV
jgi:hypothetical protein